MKTSKKLKIFALAALLTLFALTAAGCAEVTFRYTDDGVKKYQTVTVKIDGEYLERNGYDKTEVLSAVSDAFSEEGYETEIVEKSCTVIAKLELTEDHEGIVGSGYVEDRVTEKKRFFYTDFVHEGHTAFSPSDDGVYNYVYFTVLQKSLQISGGQDIIEIDKLKIYFEYATIFRQTFAENGEEYFDGELKILRYDTSSDAAVTYRYRRFDRWAWYGTLAAVSVAFATWIVIAKIKKTKIQKSI